MTRHKHFQLGIKGLIENEKGDVLLLKKSKEETVTFGHPIHWDLPGGRVEEGYTVEQTLVKELEEEIGITKFENKGFYYGVVSNVEIISNNCGLILFIFKCRIDSTVTLQLNGEHSDAEWFSKRKASELLKVKYPQEFIDYLYNWKKLVRDNIPEIIKDTNKTPVTHIADEKEYKIELLKKLKEEVIEFIDDCSIEEFADIQEILGAIKQEFHFDTEEIKKVQNDKAQKNGKFNKRIILEKVT